MPRRYNLAHFILAGVVVLGLTLLMVAVEAQARIAFVSDRDGNLEIYVMDDDGGNQRRLTDNLVHDWYPSWSPDGKHIAFTSGRDVNREIHVMDADGGNLRKLTENRQNDWHPSWSPDGKRIAFTSAREGQVEIYVMDVNGKNQHRLAKNPVHIHSWHPSWSPDSKRIVFDSHRDGDSDIYVMDADGGNVQNLTNDRFKDRDPSWSSDGKRIAFTSGREGLLDIHGFPTYEIYVMDADGGNVQNLTNNPHNDVDPAWYNPAFSVALTGKKFTMWGRLKQVDR